MAESYFYANSSISDVELQEESIVSRKKVMGNVNSNNLKPRTNEAARRIFNTYKETNEANKRKKAKS